MSEQDNPTRTGPGAGWYASAALVVFVVASLVYILARGGSEPSATSEPSSPAASSTTNTSPSTTTSASPTTAASASDGWGARGCNGTAGSGDNPTDALAAVSWEPFLASALPASPDLGPAAVEEPVRRCFQHSPAGAVMAAVNIGLAAGVPGSGEAVIDQQFTPGPGRDKAAADLASSTGALGNLVAYRVSGCTPNRCNVQIVVFGNGIFVSGLQPMIWSGDDWHVDGSVNAGEPGIVQGVPAGFTPWGPQS